MKRKLVWGSLLLGGSVSLAIVAFSNNSIFNAICVSFRQSQTEQNKSSDQLSEKTKERIKRLTQEEEFPPRNVSTNEVSDKEFNIPEDPNIFSQKDYNLRNLSWLRRNVLKEYMLYREKNDDEVNFLLEALNKFTNQPEAKGGNDLREKALKFSIEKMNPVAMTWAGIILYKAKKTDDAVKYLKEAGKKLDEKSYCSQYYVNLYTANALSKKKGTEEQWNYRKKVAELVAKMILDNFYNKDENQIAYRMVADAFYTSKWKKCFEILKNKQNSVDEWLYLCIKGEMETEEAWEKRGSGCASGVTEEGWKGFAAHLDIARDCLTKAWKMRPDLPEAAAAMITVTTGGHGNPGDTTMLWFNRSVNAQFDYRKAYKAFLWSSRPRWRGSYEMMYAFGYKCLSTMRFETAVPGYYLESLIQIGKELPDYNWRLTFRSETVDRQLQVLFNGMCKANPENTKEVEALRAICKLYCGKHSEAGKLFPKVDKSLDPCDLFSPYDDSEFLKRGWDVMEAEIKLFTGPYKDIMLKAEEDRSKGKNKDALNSYVKALEMVKDAPLAKSIILKEAGFLQLGTTAELENPRRTNPIHQAALKERLDVIKFLLENGENIDVRNNIDFTPLHYAAKSNEELGVIKFLLENGADVNITGEAGQTPLALAVKDNKNIDIVKILVENSADISKKLDDGSTILAMAFKADPSGEKPLYLLEKTGKYYDLDSEDEDGWTALHFAARYCSNLEAVKKLIEKGALLNPVNKGLCTPLILSIFNKNEDIAKHLIEKGANINNKNNDGLSALYYALAYNKDSLVQLLLEKGAEVNVGDKDNLTVLHKAICRKKKNTDIIKALIAKGADLNVRTTTGWSSFMCAVVYIDNPEIIKLMLDKGANVNEKMQSNTTALSQSIQYGTLNNFKCLIENGAGINDADNKNRSPLYRASMMGRNEMVAILLEKGANVNTKCREGKTALDVATKKEIKDLLLQHGAQSGSAL